MKDTQATGMRTEKDPLGEDAENHQATREGHGDDGKVHHDDGHPEYGIVHYGDGNRDLRLFTMAMGMWIGDNQLV